MAQTTMASELLLFVPTTTGCVLRGNGSPGIPVFFDERGVVRPLSDFMVHLAYEQGKPVSSVGTYAHYLQKFFRHLRALGVAWEEVNDGVFIAWRNQLLKTDGLASSTVSAYLSAVFWLYEWAERTGRLRYAVALYEECDDASCECHTREYRISASRTERHGNFKWSYLPAKLPRGLRHTPVDEEIERLHVALFATRTGQRDSLLLSFYEECYLRRAEALSITVDDIASWEAIDAAVAERKVFELEILGKGGRCRVVAVLPALMERARDYIEGARADAVRLGCRRDPRFREPSALFLSQTSGRPVDKNHVSRRISQIMRSAGIRNASGHRLRASGLTALVRAYDRVDEQGRRAPAEQVLWKVAELAGHRRWQSLYPYLALARSPDSSSGVEEVLRDKAKITALLRRVAELESERDSRALDEGPSSRRARKSRKPSR